MPVSTRKRPKEIPEMKWAECMVHEKRNLVCVFSVKLGPVVDKKISLEYGSELIMERKEDEERKGAQLHKTLWTANRETKTQKDK